VFLLLSFWAPHFLSTYCHFTYRWSTHRLCCCTLLQLLCSEFTAACFLSPSQHLVGIFSVRTVHPSFSAENFLQSSSETASSSPSNFDSLYVTQLGHFMPHNWVIAWHTTGLLHGTQLALCMPHNWVIVWHTSGSLTHNRVFV